MAAQLLLRRPLRVLPLLVPVLLSTPGLALRWSSAEAGGERDFVRGAELAGVELDLSSQDLDGPCTETHTEAALTAGRWVHFICKHFRTGNALMLYWNARALAFFKGASFKLTVERKGLVTNFPKEVPAPNSTPSELQSRLWKTMSKMKDVCWECPFPHGRLYGPWRLVGDLIFEETARTVESMILASEDPKTKDYTDWTDRRSWAVLHFRCDKTIWGNEQYGFLRHAFIRKRLPKSTTHMLIVGQVKSDEMLCQQILEDLVHWLEEARHLSVSLQETKGEANDWLTLATAPLLFCSSSTYCLTAAMGNPNTAYFPVNGDNMVVLPDGPELAEAASLRPPGFHFVPQDYVPGPAVSGMEWEDLQAYLHANRCQRQRHRCVPVGGAVPDKYLFHDKR
mmetsp:Transcript_371/g.1238  ORF Transcript_371/g.1238 Transcript_371/m.1238 type:complete len:396 (+) Transcript_371:86-1273(+)